MTALRMFRMVGIAVVFLFIFFAAALMSLAAVPIVRDAIGGSDNLERALYAILAPALLAFGATLLKPFQRVIQRVAESKILTKNQPPFHLLIYGVSGTGKTTLIRKFFNKGKLGNENQTVEGRIHKDLVGLDFEEKKNPVVIYDYPGEEPGQLLVNPREDFFGKPNRRIVNAVFFVVDFLPAPTDDQRKNDEDKAMVDWLADNGEEKIKKRVRDSLKYITRANANIVFTAAYSKENLSCVRLLINKYDILKEATIRGAINVAPIDKLSEYCKYLYEEVDEILRRSCEENGIEDYSVHLISAKNSEDAKGVFFDVFKKYRADFD